MTNDKPTSLRVDDCAETNPTDSPSTPQPMSDQLTVSDTDHVVLRGGIRVARELYEAVRLQVEADLHLFAPGGAHFARDLCGWPFWRQVDWRDRPMAGRCLAHLVATRRIGLVFAQRKPAYPLRYRLKAQAA